MSESAPSEVWHGTTGELEERMSAWLTEEHVRQAGDEIDAAMEHVGDAEQLELFDVPLEAESKTPPWR